MFFECFNKIEAKEAVRKPMIIFDAEID